MTASDSGKGGKRGGEGMAQDAALVKLPPPPATALRESRHVKLPPPPPPPAKPAKS